MSKSIPLTTLEVYLYFKALFLARVSLKGINVLGSIGSTLM